MAASSSQAQTPMAPPPELKRSASSLLPAFEPFSSSPALPRPPKRKLDDVDPLTYPTPIPTSSTAILSSSPPPRSILAGRHNLKRTSSVLSERAPLAAVPEIQLPADGKKMLLGRSSASCDHQLSGNRLISRVHVESWYEAAAQSSADSFQGRGGSPRDRVMILCTGHNGIRVHCLGKVYGLDKGRTFSSDVKDADIMVDVQDARVLIRWPEKSRGGLLSSDEEDEDTDDSSPSKRRALTRHSTPPRSQLPRHRLASPISPSPAVHAAMLPSSALHLPNSPSADPVVVYEDEPSPDETENGPDPAATSQSTQALSQLQSYVEHLPSDSPLSSSQEFSDHDEENDPIIHSFGPFGANLLQEMASFNASDSSHTLSAKARSHTQPLQPNISPSQTQRAIQSTKAGNFDITGHVINQLAFSRLSSTPLSTILSHLPSEADTLSKRDLKAILNQTACIGEIAREGKDAAGQPLESEYYYIPDQDEDEGRKAAVVNDLGKPGLRSCRKQHKQYYWRKPKTP